MLRKYLSKNFEGGGKLEERSLQNIITTCNKQDGLHLTSSWQEQMVGYIKHVKESLVSINQNNFQTKLRDCQLQEYLWFMEVINTESAFQPQRILPLY